MVIESMSNQEQPIFYHFCRNRISWGAIICGALVGVGISFLIKVFALSIDLSAFKTGTDGSVAIAIGGFIGLLVGAIASMFIAGMVAGHLGRLHMAHSNRINAHLGSLYGFTTWCVALLIAVALAAQLRQFVTINHHEVKSARYAEASMLRGEIRARAESRLQAEENIQMAENRDREAKMGYETSTSLFITFILFFASAVASCIGGYIGIKPEGTE